MTKVFFHRNDVAVKLPGMKILKTCIENVFHAEGTLVEQVDYIFCNDQFLLDINQRFLKHDFYTDIISFNLGDNNSVIGEVYISVERVKENALELKESFSEELRRVIFHGALHFCGYKDKTTNEKLQMRAKEDFYLGRFKKLLLL